MLNDYDDLGTVGSIKPVLVTKGYLLGQVSMILAALPFAIKVLTEKSHPEISHLCHILFLFSATFWLLWVWFLFVSLFTFWLRPLTWLVWAGSLYWLGHLS